MCEWMSESKQGSSGFGALFGRKWSNSRCRFIEVNRTSQLRPPKFENASIGQHSSRGGSVVSSNQQTRRCTRAFYFITCKSYQPPKLFPLMRVSDEPGR